MYNSHDGETAGQCFQPDLLQFCANIERVEVATPGKMFRLNAVDFVCIEDIRLGRGGDVLRGPFSQWMFSSASGYVSRVASMFHNIYAPLKSVRFAVILILDRTKKYFVRSLIVGSRANFSYLFI